MCRSVRKEYEDFEIPRECQPEACRHEIRQSALHVVALGPLYIFEGQNGEEGGGRRYNRSRIRPPEI